MSRPVPRREPKREEKPEPYRYEPKTEISEWERKELKRMLPGITDEEALVASNRFGKYIEIVWNMYHDAMADPIRRERMRIAIALKRRYDEIGKTEEEKERERKRDEERERCFNEEARQRSNPEASL